jgi:carboxyl-terminal processing protease
MSSRTRWIVIALSTPLVILAAVGGLLGAPRAPQAGFPHLRVFEDVVSLVMGAYVEEIDADKVMEGAMRGLADSLDASSSYLPPEEVAMVEAKTPPAPADTGLVVARSGYLRVLGVRDGSPAERAGIRSGDLLRAIDDKPTRDMSTFTGQRLLRGAVGSKVVVSVIRFNPAEPHTFTLQREATPTTHVTSKTLATGEGYVRISSFGAGSGDALRAQVEKLQQAGAKGIVIDVRNTADGSYVEAFKAAEVFIASGTIATRAGRDDANKEVISAPAGNKAVATPAVVLMAFGTSGPAEVFVAALAGAKRAALVGERTAGLAAEQRLVKLPENRGLWMTYARYLTMAGEPILEKGVRPDVVVEEPNPDFGDVLPSTDDMLGKALERLKSGKN